MSKLISQSEFEKRLASWHGNEYEITSVYRGMYHSIEAIHNNCGKTIHIKRAINLLRSGCCCSYCNDWFSYVDEDYPLLAQNFVDQSQTHVTKSSKQIVQIKCPCCGDIKEMKVVDYIKAGHVTCPRCNDGFSYLEKLLSNVFTELNIPYIYQFSPDWAYDYRYDFLITIANKQYIIEFDGGLGHGNNSYHGKPNQQETLKIDRKKDLLALNNGYQIIRIDGHYKDFTRIDYLSNSIEDSLGKLINFSELDWKKMDRLSQCSLFYDAVKLYKQGIIYMNDIASKLKIKPHTAYNYIYNAMRNDLLEKQTISYKISEVKKRVFCFEDGLFFDSVKDVANYYGYKYHSLFLAFERQNGYYKGRHFIYSDDISSNINLSSKIISLGKKQDNFRKIICQYDLDGNLCHIYFGKDYLPEGILMNNIWRVIQGKRTTAYGYKWSFLSRKEEFELFEFIKNNELARYFYCN